VPRQSAGLLLYRFGPDGGVQVLIGHPGGPLFARRDEGVWSVPKGEYESDEQPLAAAAREFAEELGQAPPDSERISLGEVRQMSGKRVVVWAVEGDFDIEALSSNLFEMEWPPRSKQFGRFPELDRVAWLSPDEARVKLNPAQVPFVDRLLEAVTAPRGPG
jgi:predicted NUDIX family NTP pyrophosphohydrolase